MGLTNSECRSLERLCILAECWMTLSKRSSSDGTWHAVGPCVQMGAEPTRPWGSRHSSATSSAVTAIRHKERKTDKESEMKNSKFELLSAAHLKNQKVYHPQRDEKFNCHDLLAKSSLVRCSVASYKYLASGSWSFWEEERGYGRSGGSDCYLKCPEFEPRGGR